MPIPNELLRYVDYERFIFGMSSWGHAGIPWIAACLNEHPEIHAEYASRDEYALAYKAEIDAYQFMLIAANKFPDSRVNGHVIDYGWRDFAMLRQRLGPRFYGCYFMAHPVLRLAGSIAISKEVNRKWNHDDFVRIFGLSADDPAAQRPLRLFGADADYIPVHYVFRINDMATYIDLNAMVRFEELWSRDDAWHKLVLKISGGTITDFGDRWRKYEGACVGPANGVAQAPLLQNPKDVWDSFPQYTRDQMAALLSDEARILHEKLGYDLSFVPREIDR